MEAETVLKLLDSYWYDLDFFNRSKPTSKNPFQETPDSEIPSSLPTIHTTSPPRIEKLSSSSLISDSASPNSVLFNSKLQTIFSGKESKDFEDSRPEKESQETPIKGSPLRSSVIRRRKKKGLSKSLSDLEFEELKGFMDLGFVFSEEDKDSSLASIIPGLHRLGKKSQANHYDCESNEENLGVVNDDEIDIKNSRKGEVLVNKNEVSRPYLSEAWQVKEKKKKENSLFKGRRVPAFNSEIDMKDYLRLWAHSVASAVVR